jgi:hypothetical protein
MSSNPFLSEVLVHVNPTYDVQDPKPEDVQSYQEAIMVSQEAFNEIESTNAALSSLINASMSYSHLKTSMESSNIDPALVATVSKAIGSTVGFEEAVVSLEGAADVAAKIGKTILNAIVFFFKKILSFIGILRNHSEKELSRTKKVLDKIAMRTKAEGNVKVKVSLSDGEMRWLHTASNDGPSTHINSDLAKSQKIAVQCIDEVLGKIEKEANGLAQINEVAKIHAIRESLAVSNKALKEYIIGDALVHVNDKGNAYVVTKAEESKGGGKEYEVDLHTAKSVVEEIVSTKKFVVTYGSKLESRSNKLESVLKTVAEKAATTHEEQLSSALKSIIDELKGMIVDSIKIVKHVEETSSHILNIYDRLVH